MDQTDAATLASVLRESWRKMAVSLDNCRSQTYDGASNMAGHLNGVAASIFTTLVRASPKCLALFKNIQHQSPSLAPNIKPLCPTRWTVHTGAINSVLQNYGTLCETLDEIGADSHGEPAAKALGL